MGKRIRSCGRLALCVMMSLCAMQGVVRAETEPVPVGAIPLPVGKTSTVRGRGMTWYVDGPTVIPPNVEIRIELGTTILGINNASLEVQGGLKVHGTQGSWVKMKNIDFSPTVHAKRGFHLDMVDFYGCKFVHPEKAPLGGGLTIENSTFQRDCTLKFRVHDSFLKIMTVEAGCACEIHAVPSSKKFIEIEVRSSWMRELTLTGMCRATVRHSELKAGITCRNVHDVEIDGCDVEADITFRQGPEDVFKKVVLTKCNMLSGANVVLDRPKGPKTKKERVKLDKFYFAPGERRVKALQGKAIAKRVKDGDDLPKGEGSVFATWGAANKRKHQLVSYTLKQRIPPLN